MALFGPPLKEVWLELAGEIGGTFYKGAFARSARVEKMYGNLMLTLDTYTVSTGKSSVTYTRMRTPFNRENDIEFKLGRKNIFSGLGSLFGMPVIETYDYDFNDEFVIKGNDENVLKEIFQNEDIKEAVKFQKKIILRVKPYPERKHPGAGELYFQMTGVLKDMDKLKNLFKMFELVLDELIKNGVAAADDPGVRLYGGKDEK